MAFITEDPYHLPPHKFPLYTWELNENSTRWDYLRASPDEGTRLIHWIVWSILLFFVSGTIFVVFFAVLMSPIRKNSFNLYLVYLMIPDWVFSFGCMIMCVLNAIKGDYWGIGMCYSQSVIFIFGVAGNAWMNAVIAHKLYEMLSFSQDFRRFKPPTRKQVTTQAMLVYCWALFVSSWGVIDTSWFPHKSMIMNGNACVPVEYDIASTIFFWIVFTPSAIGLPMVYVCYVLWRVYRRGLMPPAGRRRTISIYFFRLAIVFALLWFPALFLLYMVGHVIPKWGGWSGGTWSHMQGAVSALVSMMKPDIYQAVQDLIHCRYDCCYCCFCRTRSTNVNHHHNHNHCSHNHPSHQLDGSSRQMSPSKRGNSARGSLLKQMSALLVSGASSNNKDVSCTKSDYHEPSAEGDTADIADICKDRISLSISKEIQLGLPTHHEPSSMLSNITTKSGKEEESSPLDHNDGKEDNAFTSEQLPQQNQQQFLGENKMATQIVVDAEDLIPVSPFDTKITNDNHDNDVENNNVHHEPHQQEVRQDDDDDHDDAAAPLEDNDNDNDDYSCHSEHLVWESEWE